MAAAEIKDELKALIDKGDPELLELLLQVAKDYNSMDFTRPGGPMGKADLIQRIVEARARLKSGQFFSMDELDEEMKTW